MAAYNNGSRRAPNVSQYLNDLNTIPPTHEIANGNEISLAEADLDFLTHAEFFDFDSFDPNNVDHFNHSPTHGGRNHGSHAPVNASGFQYGDFQSFPPVVGSSPEGSTGLHTPQYAHHQGSFPQTGDKRKASTTNNIPSPSDLEEQSRMAAEEDKRRRNTAASARFRVKKKQREQALEKQAKEMTDKVQQLEGKVQQLEMENKWLKGLITDKNDGKTLETLQKEKETEDRKPGDNTDGVGTEVKTEMRGVV